MSRERPLNSTIAGHAEERAPVYLKGLNGLRALAAFAVVLSHLNKWMGDFALPRKGTSQLSDYGVTIFFSLSGFLITYLLLLERERQPIDLGKFYLRRILRIWPLYYAYVALVVSYLFLTARSALPGSLGYYLALAANIPYVQHRPLPHLAHFWSLGVEEQFYLFWPLMLKRARAPLRAISWFAITCIIVRVACRALPFLGEVHEYLYVTRFDCMAIGGLGAILFHRRDPRLLLWARHKVAQIACWGIIALTAVNRFAIPLFSHDVVAIVTVCIIVEQITESRHVINLDHPVAEFLGKISYGIYVLHPMVIVACAYGLRELHVQELPKYLLVYASVLALTVLCAFGSYSLFERPFLALKKRYAVVNSLAARTRRELPSQTSVLPSA